MASETSAPRPSTRTYAFPRRLAVDMAREDDVATKLKLATERGIGPTRRRGRARARARQLGRRARSVGRKSSETHTRARLDASRAASFDRRLGDDLHRHRLDARERRPRASHPRARDAIDAIDANGRWIARAIHLRRSSSRGVELNARKRRRTRDDHRASTSRDRHLHRCHCAQRRRSGSGTRTASEIWRRRRQAVDRGVTFVDTRGADRRSRVC